MKPVLTADEYNRVDKAFTGDLIQAMDRAGYAVALAAVRNGAGYGSRVSVLAGPGNNGGDGYVAARYLSERGCHVVVHALGEPKTAEAADAAAKAGASGLRIRPVGEPGDEDLIIDALFGGGVRDGLPEAVLPWIDTSAPVVAVDYPTGLDPNTGKVEDVSFVAVETVTFQNLKTGHVRGHGPDVCGRVTVVDIGIPDGKPCMYVAEEADAPRPPRERQVHKWSAGAVLVVGGSTGLVGASIFAGQSALGFGAGSVVVATPNRDTVSTVAPELPTFSPSEALSRVDRFDVVLAGPGLDAADQQDVLPILAKSSQVLLDAGALNPEALEAALEGDGKVVLTPHAGEFERVAGVAPGAFAARSFANRSGAVVLLKGNPTLITDGDLPVLVDTGGPELASIGTGDVLAGMIAALWSRGLHPTRAAISGAYWHGVAAADLMAREGVTAPRLASHVRRFAW